MGATGAAQSSRAPSLAAWLMARDRLTLSAAPKPERQVRLGQEWLICAGSRPPFQHDPSNKLRSTMQKWQISAILRPRGHQLQIRALEPSTS